MLAAGEIAHWTAIKINAVEALYSDSTVTDVAVSVVPSSPISSEVIDEGFTTNSVESGFIASVAELKAASIWPPVNGASIRYTDAGGTDRRFEVMPGGGEKFFRVFGNYGVMAKINVKEVSVA